MSKQDQIKWDRKYIDKRALLDLRPPSEKLVKIFEQIKKGQALDLASGNGRHTRYMAANGFEVDAVDISQVAIDTLAMQSRVEKLDKRICLTRGDLDDYTLSTEHYDLIVMSNYLDRELIERAQRGLKRGGVFFVETYMDDPSNEKKDSNPNFLLKKGELLDIFADGFDVLLYEEFDNEPHEMFRMKKQAIAVKKLV